MSRPKWGLHRNRRGRRQYPPERTNRSKQESIQSPNALLHLLPFAWRSKLDRCPRVSSRWEGKPCEVPD